MGIIERARQMVETGSMDIPETEKKEPETSKKPENKPKEEPTERKKNRVVQYFREVRDELKKVEWPKRKDVYRGTMIVVGLSAFLALVLGAFDFVFTYILEKTLQNF